MSKKRRVAIKSVLWTIATLPLLLLWYAATQGKLGPDPGEEIVHQLGLCALWLLIATLSITPLRKLTRNAEWLRYRRLLGLFCFFYACLHLLAFALFIVGLNLEQLAIEFSERNYIVAGLAAILCLLPLAVTSTQGWQKKLGMRWKRLHQLVYLAAVLVLVHLWWQVRSDYGEAFLYTALLGGLLFIRVLLHKA
ncbi:MAG: protein-methionine-sulfoxide reductase heme-binding subunit MsrQ [Pseudomonadales bacterium]